MIKKSLIKLNVILFLTIFVIVGCNLNTSKKNNLESEKILIERMQLDCFKQFIKSNKLKYSIEDIQYDISNPILSKFAENQINISNIIDNNIKDIFFKIEEIKSILIKQNTSISSKNDLKILTSQRKFNFLNPSIIDIQNVDFIEFKTKEAILKKSIIELQQKIKNIQINIFNKFSAYYGFKNEDNFTSNFNSYKAEFDSYVLTDKKANEFLCGASFKRKLDQINNELNFNKEYWHKAYSENCSSPIIFCNLINLQSDILYTRSLIFEMISQNLYCESLKIRRQN